MKTKIVILSLLCTAIVSKANTLLVVHPLVGEEQAEVISSIGYVKITSDSLYIYSFSNILLGKNAIKDICNIRYDKQEVATKFIDADVATLRIYPNPTHDMLIIESANAEKAFIFDLNGRLQQSVALFGDKVTINVTSLPKGEYILLLNAQTFKFIKQ